MASRPYSAALGEEAHPDPVARAVGEVFRRLRYRLYRWLHARLAGEFRLPSQLEAVNAQMQGLMGVELVPMIDTLRPSGTLLSVEVDLRDHWTTMWNTGEGMAFSAQYGAGWRLSIQGTGQVIYREGMLLLGDSRMKGRVRHDSRD